MSPLRCASRAVASSFWSGVSRLLRGGGTRAHRVGGAELSLSDSGCGPQPKVPSRAAYQGLGFVGGMDAVTLWPRSLRHSAPATSSRTHPPPRIKQVAWKAGRRGLLICADQPGGPCPGEAFPARPHCVSPAAHPPWVLQMGPCGFAGSVCAATTDGGFENRGVCVFSPSETQAEKTCLRPRRPRPRPLPRPVSSPCSHGCPSVSIYVPTSSSRDTGHVQPHSEFRGAGTPTS